MSQSYEAVIRAYGSSMNTIEPIPYGNDYEYLSPLSLSNLFAAAEKILAQECPNGGELLGIVTPSGDFITA